MTIDESAGIINLKYPISIPKAGGGEIETTRLKMGRLKLKHLRLLPHDFVEKEGKVELASLIPLIAGIADIPIESADEIDIEDFENIINGLMSFLAVSPMVGKK